MKLVLLIFLVSQLSQDFLRKVARRDLNGDGIEENIRLVYADQEGNFTINIGSIEYSNKLSDSVDGFILVGCQRKRQISRSSDPYAGAKR